MIKKSILIIVLLVLPVFCYARPFERELKLPEDYRSQRLTKLFPVGPGQTKTLFDINGPGCITHIWMTTNKYNDFRKIILRMYWDDETDPSVEAPLTDFFGVGHNLASTDEYYSNPCLALNPFNGYNSYFQMPFAKNGKVTITNEQDIDIKGWVYFQADYEEYDKLSKNVPYFHAQWRREAPALRRGRPYTVIEAVGKGFLAGMTYHIRVDDSADDWCHGGGDTVYIDSETYPGCINGIGGEDYFGASWGIDPFVSPYSGCTYDVEDKKLSMYRFYLESPIPFEQSVRLSFGAMANEITSVGYWYQNEPHQIFFEMPEAELCLPENNLEPGSHDIELLPEKQINVAVIGPFKGDINTEFQPEIKIDLNEPIETNYERRYKIDNPGEDDRLVKWERARTTLGWLDFEALYRPKMEGARGVQTISGSVAYAYVRLYSERSRSCKLHLGYDDPVRVWINSKQIADFSEESGFNGKTLKFKLQKGANDLLIKVANSVNQNWSVFAISMDFPKVKGIQFDEFTDLSPSQEYARPSEPAQTDN